MTFDFDLAYDILAKIEELPPGQATSTGNLVDPMQFPDEGNHPTPYECEFIRVSYHMGQLIDSGLLEARAIDLVGKPATDYTVFPGLQGAEGLTLNGQQYLSMLRDNTAKNRIKEKLKTGFLNVAEALSVDVIKELLF